MADKLAVYNETLRTHLGSRRLASLDEDRSPRRALDDAWADQVKFCLEQAPWSFACRTSGIEYTPSAKPGFGFLRAFERPDDWLKTATIAADPELRDPLTRFTDEGPYLFADPDVIFLRYVSLDPEYGLDLSRWPATFASYVATRLAVTLCASITGSDGKVEKLLVVEKRARQTAMSYDAMNRPPAFAPVGSWVRARRGSSPSRDGR